MVLVEPTEEVEHAESPLGNPPPPDRHEAFGARRFRAYFQLHAQQVLRDPVQEDLLISGIGQDFLHAVQVAPERGHHLLGQRPVGPMGRVHHHAPDQAQGVGDHVTLPAVDLLVAVHARLLTDERSHLNRLAINTHQDGGGLLAPA